MLPRVDIISGGFPCQDISNAGKRTGIAGARSGLWGAMVRAIRMVRPRYAVVENVAALLGRGMGRVLGDLAESGYDAEWDCLPAAAFGAPHRRDRVFIVGRRIVDDTLRDGHNNRQSPTAPQPDSNGKKNGLSRPASLDAPTLPDTTCQRKGPIPAGQGRERERTPDSDRRGEGMAYTQVFGKREQTNQTNTEPGSREPRPFFGSGGWWATEPDVGRVAHGIPARVDRLRGLGNAVVPQIAEWLARKILAPDSAGWRE